MKLFAGIGWRLRRAWSTGRRGERIAGRFLKAQRYRVCARNVRNRFGEIDLIAEAPDGRTMVLVEVKTGQQGSAIRPEVHVNADKRRRLAALGAQFARRYGLTRRPWRFDVIAVELDGRRVKPIIRHHRGAFEAPF